MLMLQQAADAKCYLASRNKKPFKLSKGRLYNAHEPTLLSLVTLKFLFMYFLTVECYNIHHDTTLKIDIIILFDICFCIGVWRGGN